MIIITLFLFLYFIIWKNIINDFKKRVIIDIKALNKIIILNVYPIPL